MCISYEQTFSLLSNACLKCRNTDLLDFFKNALVIFHSHTFCFLSNAHLRSTNAYIQSALLVYCFIETASKFKYVRFQTLSKLVTLISGKYHKNSQYKI